MTEALDLDVTGGEQDCELPVWRGMIETRAVDVLQPDVCYVGGIGRTLRVAKMAHAAGMTNHAERRQPVAGDAVHDARRARDPE